MRDNYDFIVIIAHPDDERHIFGTILLLVEYGYKCLIVSLTSGQMGTYGNEETRRAEFKEASAKLGVQSMILDFYGYRNL